MPGILWIAVIGLLAGIIARFLLPGPNNPQGFLVTMVIGIAGSFVATFIGQSMGWYRHDQGAGLIGATLGAIIVLFIWAPARGPAHRHRSRRHQYKLASPARLVTQGAEYG